MNEKTALIDYFETGNQETDAAAKAIVASDFEYSEHCGGHKSKSCWLG